MLAQLTFTPVESKKLISKAVVGLEAVQRAAQSGKVAIHPSSTTYFITEQLLGRKPPSNVWVCGVIVPKGTCIEAAMTIRVTHKRETDPKAATGPKPDKHSPGQFKRVHIVQNGQFETGIPLDDVLEGMGQDDIFVKGANALDPQGNAAVLIGNDMEGGTLGRVMAASRRKGFKIICPVGLEKLIPIPVGQAARVANRNAYHYTMGVACSLLPLDMQRVQVITEIQAIELLTGASAVPIACGGLGGAEGAVTLAAQGNEGQIEKLVAIAEECKGARLPQTRVNSCLDCPVTFCTFPRVDKPWAVT